jgi:hypothetical protein
MWHSPSRRALVSRSRKGQGQRRKRRAEGTVRRERQHRRERRGITVALQHGDLDIVADSAIDRLDLTVPGLELRSGKVTRGLGLPERCPGQGRDQA